MRASGEAQALAYIAKHLGRDPYQVWNAGIDPLPPHPRPRVYRYLLGAMAMWLEDQEREKYKMVAESQGAKIKLNSMFDQWGSGG